MTIRLWFPWCLWKDGIIISLWHPFQPTTASHIGYLVVNIKSSESKYISYMFPCTHVTDSSHGNIVHTEITWNCFHVDRHIKFDTCVLHTELNVHCQQTLQSLDFFHQSAWRYDLVGHLRAWTLSRQVCSHGSIFASSSLWVGWYGQRVFWLRNVFFL